MNLNKLPKGILAISLIEVAIGAITFLAVTASLLQHLNTKPFNVLIFVYVTSILSFGLGLGVLTLKREVYELLLFFAGVVILTKILIFTNLVSLNGAIETTLPQNIKNTVSLIYHAFIIYYLRFSPARSLFK